MEIRKLVVTNIRKAIKCSGLKQKVIAERCGMTQNQFSAMINFRREIKAEDIPVICDALGIQPNELFSGIRT